jgi:TrmH family RNA methyltransferase
MTRTLRGRPIQLKPLKWYKKLATKKGRVEAGAFLVEGERAVEQIATAHPDQILEIITTNELPQRYRNYSIRSLTESQFRSICLSKTPQGIMALVRIPLGIYSDQLPEHPGNKILLLEDIQDPGNVGTLIRTAAAFNFSGVILTKKCADPLSPKCVQSTAGSLLSVWIRRTAQYLGLVETLKQGGHTFIAADLEGTDDPSVLTGRDTILLGLGNEASGISEPLRKASHYRMRISILREKAESLNVAVCGSILMYLSSRKP